MKIGLTVRQRMVIAFVCFTLAVMGFMMKLPSVFRHMDKELHAAFYFLAAAFLNILFAKAKLWRHAVIFFGLYLFGMAIEYAQAYSNRFFRKRIHGRYDPEDIEYNLNGLIAFSVVWLVFTLGNFIYQKAVENPNKHHANEIKKGERSSVTNSTISSLLLKLLKTEVSETIVGGSNGSMIVLHFDINKFSITIKSAWRLSRNKKVLTGWNESNDAQTGVKAIEIKALLNDKVSKVLVNDFYDLEITFLSGKMLTVFCDVTPNYIPADYDVNWAVCDHQANQCMMITKDSTIREGRYC